MVDASYPPQVDPQPVPPPTVPEGAGVAPQAQPGPQYDFSQGDALRKAAGDPLAQADAMSAQRRAVLNPLMNDVQQAGVRQQQHSQARQQQLASNPQSPEPQQGMGIQAAANWVMIATGIGALAGAMTRRSTTNALAAFTGALEGVQQGNKQAFEQNKTIWEQENKRINQQLEQQRDAYMEIMNSDKMDLNMKMLMLQQKAAELHDDQTAQIAARKDMQLWAERADKLEIARQQGVIAFQKLQTTLGRYGGGAGASGSDSGGIDDIAKAISQYRQAPYQGISARSPEARRVMERVYQMNPDYDARQFSQSNRGVTAFSTGQQGNSLRAIQVADSHLQTLEQLGLALKNGDTKAVNRWRNVFRDQTGSELPTNFDAAKQIVAAEVIKAVAASGGGVNERLEAAKRIDGASSVPQLLGAVGVYRQLLGGQREGFKQQYENATGKTDFDQRFPIPKGMEGSGAQQPGGGQIIKYDAQGNRI